MRHATLSAIVLLLMLAALATGAQELSITSENDIVAHSPTPDDLYTFSEAFQLETHGLDLSLRENAFTDRAAGTRFDETYLSVGRRLPVLPRWNLAAEAGVVHVGRGLFGQKVQNLVHGAIGCDPIHLRYLDSSIHPRLALAAVLRSTVGRTLSWGPRLDVDMVPGLRSWALISAEAAWRATDWLNIDMVFGARLTRAYYAALVPHLAPSAAAARLAVVLGHHLFVSWSYNDYGTKREHVTVGYRLALGGRRRVSRLGGGPLRMGRR